MPEPDLQRVETIFQAAVDLPEGARAAYLDGACDGDADLRERVERLLGHHARDVTLDPPAGRPAGATATEGPGSVIGRYKLLQVIGEGGFGVVYMAEQTEPVVRKVALKIIKLGMDTREVIARFEAERQALAMMEHPHIARVLDGGATDSGRPYFVMELVRGVPITEFCDRDDLSTRQRLELFLQVCGAVQHAHQKGVIHRDLKPSNVLVTLHDGTPVPKVIDFGVAKAMHARLTDKTLFTRYEQFIGTPQYMSPEQAEMSALDVDTRTDIYSLGVLLYELLTGTTPFDAEALRAAGLAEIQRIIRDERPPRPSVRISTTGDARIAGRRGLDVAALSRHLRGDLDWIVMRALEKDRGRRYPSASELAEDIRRHLRREPVVAGPPGAGYRLSRFLARNRAAVLSGGLVLLVLLAGIVGTTTGMIRAQASARDAHEQEQEAQAQAEHALSALEFLDGMLALTDRGVALDPEVSVQTLLDRTAPRIDAAFEDHPWAEARIRATIGRAYHSLSRDAQAEPHLRRMIAIVEAQAAAGADPATLGPGFRPLDFYTALWALTNVCFNLEREDAFAVAHRARTVGLACIEATTPAAADALRRFAEAVGRDAWSTEAHAMAEIPDLFADAVAASETALAPDDPRWPIVADTFLAAGYTVWYTPHEHLAEDFFGQALAIQRRVLPPDHPDTAQTVGMLVNIKNNLGKSAEVERLIRDSIESMRRVHGEDEYPVAVAEAMLGESLVGQSNYAEAEPILLRAHEIILATVGSESNFIATESFQRLVDLYDGWGRPERADPFRAVLARTCATSLTVHPWSTTRRILGPEHADLRALLEEADAACGGISFAAAPECARPPRPPGSSPGSPSSAGPASTPRTRGRRRWPACCWPGRTPSIPPPRSRRVASRPKRRWPSSPVGGTPSPSPAPRPWPCGRKPPTARATPGSPAAPRPRRGRCSAPSRGTPSGSGPPPRPASGGVLLTLGMHEPAAVLLRSARDRLAEQLGAEHPDAAYVAGMLEALPTTDRTP